MNGVREKDTGWAKFQEIAKALGGKNNVKVGVLDDGSSGSDRREGGFTNAQIAAVHEFGSSDGRIPQRSFMRASFDKHRPDNVAALKKLLTRVVEGKMSVDQLLNTMGAKIATDMKNFVTQGDQVPPPNAPSTIWKKTFRERAAVSKAHGAVTASQNTNALRWFSAKALGRRGADKMNRGASSGAVRGLVSATSKFIDATGSVRTLVDTGRMIDSITWSLVKR